MCSNLQCIENNIFKKQGEKYPDELSHRERVEQDPKEQDDQQKDNR